MQKVTTFEHGGKVYEVRAIPTLNGWKVRIFVEGIPANGFTYSVDSEVYQDAAIDGVPEDLVAGLMETAERDFRRGLTQELVADERLPTTISRRKTINSNHVWSAWRLTAPAQMTPGSPLVRLCSEGCWTAPTQKTNPEGQQVASGTISLAFDRSRPRR
jgi:hypothetical protein